MGRYYLIATFLVVSALLVGTVVQWRKTAFEVASVRSSGTPSASRPQAQTTYPPRGVTGRAPWALSALPECFVQDSEARGTAPFVRAQLPPEAQLVPSGSRLVSADCTLRVGARSATVERGTERLVIPPQAAFFIVGRRLALLRRDAAGAELRIYHRSDGAPVAFASGATSPAR
jgi:hypothetical protein